MSRASLYEAMCAVGNWLGMGAGRRGGIARVRAKVCTAGFGYAHTAARKPPARRQAKKSPSGVGYRNACQVGATTNASVKPNVRWMMRRLVLISPMSLWWWVQRTSVPRGLWPHRRPRSEARVVDLAVHRRRRQILLAAP